MYLLGGYPMRKRRSLPKEDQPKEKLKRFGASYLTDSELLALVIQAGGKDYTSSQTAQSLLTGFGGYANLALLGYTQFARERGIGPVKATALVALFEIARRMQSKSLPKQLHIQEPESIYEHFAPKLRHLKHEEFYLLSLNAANRLIKCSLISKGILNASLVHPREVFKTAILEAAASIILLHNHPSGEVLPSFEDESITNRLIEAGQLLNIPVLDHIIVGGRGYYSFREKGLIG